jgi:hypothetical protein
MERPLMKKNAWPPTDIRELSGHVEEERCVLSRVKTSVL